jgi:hypothetical protein
MKTPTNASTHRAIQLGTCQFCEGTFCLHDGKLVLHGFRRPGTGTIHGRCRGTDKLPYEVTCDDLKAELPGMKERLVFSKARLAEFTAETVLYFEGFFKVSIIRGNSEWLTASAFVTDARLWTRIISTEKNECARNVDGLEFNVARYTRRIAAWKLTPVTETTVEKMNDALRAEIAGRAKVRANARTEKDAAASARKVKKDARKVELQAKLDGFAATFKALALQPESPARKAAVKAQVEEIRKPKHQRGFEAWGVWEMGCTDALITLGLAKRSADGCVSYAYYW